MTPAEIGGSAGRFVLQGIGTLATFLVVAAALRIALELWVEGAEATSWDRTALLTDVTGWAVGWLLARVLEGGGPGLAAGAFGAVALLATDAARYRLLHEGSLRRLEALEELRRAGQRMVARGGSFDALAERIASECSNVVPCSWLQFDLLSPEGTHGTWGAGPDGVLKEGPAQPPAYPTALPGVHRRPRWEVISRELRAAEQVVGRLCLWCDPRKLDSGDLRLLDSLLPHFAGSAQRALLDREASEDPLTGVAVRRVLDRRLQEVYRECCESGESMAVILCDLDFFKRINDTFGHGTGDRALVAVAQTLEQGRRATDLCARYGGEEFTLLLEKTDGDTALRVAERLREAVEALTLEEEGERVPLTLSAGVASFPELHVKTPSELVLLADEALYEAKRQGRNLCLLDLGRGRYRSPRGGLHEAQDLPGEPEVPRLFS
jgi:diguanylate cyclase (GGDEF)-like protein